LGANGHFEPAHDDCFDGLHDLPSFIAVVESGALAEQRSSSSEQLLTDDGTHLLGALYREHFDLVWRGLRRLGVPLSMVDDATQDVFLVVQRRLPEIRAMSTPRSWIYGITVHMARYYRRKAARAYSEDTELSLVDEHARSPAEQAENRQALELMYFVLGKLSDAHREVFVLADIEELSAKDIALLLKLPQNTVYSRLRHAHAQFETLVARQNRAPERTR
jgi:RNA polymerase sigma-70 factor (ECF subfamily)